jgi:hypothetical protein
MHTSLPMRPERPRIKHSADLGRLRRRAIHSNRFLQRSLFLNAENDLVAHPLARMCRTVTTAWGIGKLWWKFPIRTDQLVPVEARSPFHASGSQALIVKRIIRLSEG